jgi:amino acid transporter, AAT family
VQGYSSFIPEFKGVEFVSFYVEVPVMALMYVAWILSRPQPARRDGVLRAFGEDLVDYKTVDLDRDEYAEVEADKVLDQKRESRLKGRQGWLWRCYYWIA